MRLITILLAVAGLYGQDLPSPAALMKRQQEAVRNHRSIQFDGEITMEVIRGDDVSKTTSEMALAYRHPGRLRLESRMQGIGVTIVSDGESTWTYNAATKRYMRQGAAPGPAGVLALMGIRNLPAFSKLQTEAKTVRAETLEIDGRKRACWVVESQIGKAESADAQDLQFNGGVMDYWIDQESGIDLQVVLTLKLGANGVGDVTLRQTAVKRNLKIDEPIPDSTFAFTPPEGAVELAEVPGVGLPRPNLTGKAAPPFSIRAADGKTYTLAKLKGKPVLLYFRTAWCGSCGWSNEELAKAYGGKRLVVVRVDGDNDSEILDDYGVNAFPTFVLIGADGKVLRHDIGWKAAVPKT